jgi:tetratricopeptide (TPR) repeat protein
MAQHVENNASTILARAYPELGEADKRVLSYASAMGMEFDWSVLQVSTEIEEEPLAESLERMVHRGILHEFNYGDSYGFVQVVTLAQAYREVSSSRLRVIHRKIAGAYEKLNPDPGPDVIPKMARHFHLGGIHDKSLLFNRYAATLAVNAFSPDVAVQYLERALEDLEALPGDHRLEEADVLKEIGEQYGAMGDNTKEDSFYGKSLAKLPREEVTSHALILLSRADSARDRDQVGLSRKYCEEAIRLLEKVGHKKGLAMAHRILGRAASKESHFEVAKKEIEAALGYLDPEKDAMDVARCYTDLGDIYGDVNNAEEQERAVGFYRKAITTLEPLHDYHELGRAHLNLAVTIGNPQPREALNELMEVRACAEKTKDKRFLAWALFNSVGLHLSLGEAEQAAQNNDEARRILSTFNIPLGMQQITLNDAILAQHRKAYPESEMAYLDALKRAEDLSYPPIIVEVLMHLGSMYVDWGRRDNALKVVSRIKEIGEDKIDPPNRPTYEALKKQLEA